MRNITNNLSLLRDDHVDPPLPAFFTLYLHTARTWPPPSKVDAAWMPGIATRRRAVLKRALTAVRDSWTGTATANYWAGPYSPIYSRLCLRELVRRHVGAYASGPALPNKERHERALRCVRWREFQLRYLPGVGYIEKRHETSLWSRTVASRVW